MKKILLAMVVLLVTVLSSIVQAAPGEWWEVTAKMEMEGMPFAMPATTTKVCMPKGGESDPRYTQGKDSNCKMTDVKQSGNTVKYKGTCVNHGETMNMAGETTHDANSFKSNAKMTGKSHGDNINMSMMSSGKRIGGSCDTEELSRKVQAQGKVAMAQRDEMLSKTCDISSYDTSRLIYSSSLFVDARPTCPGKKEAYCKTLNKEISRDNKAFEELDRSEKMQGKEGQPSVVKACNLNMESTRKSLCKAKSKRGPLSFLESYCPAEAKAYRELERKRADCGGRGFTGVNYDSLMKKCMGGEMLDNAADENPPAKAGKSSTAKDAESSATGAMSSEAVKEGTKALKGLFGF